MIVGHVKVQDGTRAENLTGISDAATAIIYRNETKQLDGARLLLAGGEHKPHLDVPREYPEELRGASSQGPPQRNSGGKSS